MKTIEDQHKLSTSALAKALEVPSSQLFVTLKDYGWIKKLEDVWTLTTKGEFEGGEYVHSKRYGRYIVWPFELTEHPLLQALEDNRHITATSLGKVVGLNAREVNRIMAELGWLKHGFQGWELTIHGEQCGGIQLENESSGTFYVVWPQLIKQNSLFSDALSAAENLFSPKKEVDNSLADDLFSQQTELPQYVTAIDGHVHESRSRSQICHWLYMAGIVHSCQRRLPVEAEHLTDFYIPTHQIYIECWDDESGSGLASRLQRKELYSQFDYQVINIEKKHLEQLDEYLTREFRKHGVRIY